MKIEVETRLTPAAHATAQQVVAAHDRIRPHVRRTPTERSVHLGPNVFLKCEHLQRTGSFKLRGAFNRLLTLTPAQRAAGCVAASTGNHGLAMVHAMASLGVQGKVFVGEDTLADKIAAMRAVGGTVVIAGPDAGAAEQLARFHAEEIGAVYVSPYNDPLIVAGQGTIGLELLEEVPHLDAVLVSVGGGGLIGGIAAVLKTRNPSIQVIGCQPANECLMARSVQAGRLIDTPRLPTISDGTVGQIEEGSITFELCRTLVDCYVTATEEQIAHALVRTLDTEHLLLEGSAALAIACYEQLREELAGSTVAILCCGGNIGANSLRKVFSMVKS